MDGGNKHDKALCSNEINHELYDSQQQRRGNSVVHDYEAMIRKHIPSSLTQINDQRRSQLWDPKTMLSNLSIMEEKIHQLQELVQLIVRTTQPNQLVIQQQQLVTADLTSIIIQLISTAGSLLPSVNNPHFPTPAFGNEINVPDNKYNDNDSNNYVSDSNTIKNIVSKVEDDSNDMDIHDEDVDDLPPGSYEILQLEKEEILAPHTHFCVICGKGFKRDANLRMHMRGHGDEYKTPAALAKPHKEIGSEAKLIKRYSCPFVGCKRNKDHNKFQPLKTILCVKNHYKRSHCDKSYTCSRCNTKKFSVIADLKTHEKHCGRDRWLCSCGTTFSRKDKLFGHISLFQGHTPAIPLDAFIHDNAQGDHDTNTNIQGSKEVEFFDFNFNSNGSSGSGIGEPSACYSPFQGSMFEESDSLSFLSSGSGNYLWKNGGESSSKDLQG